MSKRSMVRFIYQDFYDFARLIYVPLGSKALLLDSAFSQEKDDYEEYYEVFEVLAVEGLEVNRPWDSLRSGSEKYLGKVAVCDVVFDPSRRKTIDIEGVRAILGR